MNFFEIAMMFDGLVGLTATADSLRDWLALLNVTRWSEPGNIPYFLNRSGKPMDFVSFFAWPPTPHRKGGVPSLPSRAGFGEGWRKRIHVAHGGRAASRRSATAR